MKKIAIFGSSGHGSDVADIAIDNGYTDIIFLTQDIGIESYCGFSVMKDTPEVVKKLDEKGFYFALGVGDPALREKIYTKYPTLSYPTLIHSSVTKGNCQQRSINTCRGSIFAAGSRISNNVIVGDFCFIGINTVIGHDCIVENFVSLMPCVVISGNVHIYKGAYLGCNSSLRQGMPDRKLLIGKFSIVGMGTVVLKDVPENHRAIGVPAINSQKL